MTTTVVATKTTNHLLAFQFSTRSHWNYRINFSSPSSSSTTERPNHHHPPPPPSCANNKSIRRRLQLKEEIDIDDHYDDFDVDDDEGDGELLLAVDDFFVTPEQISFLRKEASKRQARNKLPRYNLLTVSSSSAGLLPQKEEEDDCFFSSDDETTMAVASSISNLFEQSELIEVRGLGTNSKRKVHEMAHALASTLENVYEMPVVVVEIRGFAVKLYRPWSSSDDDAAAREGRIRLRSKYKPGQWTRKAKPIRDGRGQIVTDEYGNSVKEVPED